jgi:hypothetical protein
VIGTTIPPMQRVYVGSTRVLSTLLVVLGLVLVVSSLARGGGPAALGVLVGAGMTLGGLGRLWLLRGAGDDAR